MVIMNRFIQDLSHDTINDIIERSTGQKSFSAKDFFTDVATVTLSACCVPEGNTRPWQGPAARRLTYPIWTQLKQQVDKHFRTEGIERSELLYTSITGALRAQLVPNILEHVATAVPRVEKQFVKWSIERWAEQFLCTDNDGDDDDDEDQTPKKTKQRLELALLRALDGIPINWEQVLGDAANVRDLTAAAASLQAISQTTLNEKPKGEVRDAILASLKDERKQWSCKSQKEQFPFERLSTIATKLAASQDEPRLVLPPIKRAKASISRGRTIDLCALFPTTWARLHSDEGIPAFAPTDNEMAIKSHGILKYIPYLRFLRAKASTCAREAFEKSAGMGWRHKPTMSGFSMAPMPSFRPFFLRLDSTSLRDVLWRTSFGAELDAGESIRQVMSVPTPPMPGMDARSVLTDGATICFCFTLRRVKGASKEDNAPPPRVHENYTSFQLNRLERRKLIKGLKGPLSPLVQERPIHKWSGLVTPAALRVALQQKLNITDNDEFCRMLPAHVKFAGE